MPFPPPPDKGGCRAFFKSCREEFEGHLRVCNLLTLNSGCDQNNLMTGKHVQYMSFLYYESKFELQYAEWRHWLPLSVHLYAHFMIICDKQSRMTEVELEPKTRKMYPSLLEQWCGFFSSSSSSLITEGQRRKD